MGTDVGIGNEAQAVARAPRGRRWLRRLVLLILALAAGAAAGYYYKFGRLKASEPYQEALKTLRANEEVVKHLGEPIQDGWFPDGEINNDPNHGEARLHFHVAGLKSKAAVYAVARRIGGTWGLSQLEVSPASGGFIKIKIDVYVGGGRDDAPRWP